VAVLVLSSSLTPSQYLARRRRLQLSPDRVGEDGEAKSYRDVMAEASVIREKEQVLRKIRDKEAATGVVEDDVSRQKRRRRWDDEDGGAATTASASSSVAETAAARPSRWSSDSASEAKRTKLSTTMEETPSFLGATPAVRGSAVQSMGATPLIGSASMMATPAAVLAASTVGRALQAPRTRWEREVQERNALLTDADLDMMLPGESEGYVVADPPSDYKPLMTPMRKLMSTPAQGSTLETPGGFRMTSTPSAADFGIPIALGASASFSGEEVMADASLVGGDLPPIRPEEAHLFAPLLDKSAMEDEDDAISARRETEAADRAAQQLRASGETSAAAIDKARKAAIRSYRTERAERRSTVAVAAALLKIKSGTPLQRKISMKWLATSAKELGAPLLFRQLLPMLNADSLEDHERHVLVKVIDRVLFELDDAVKPFVHKILSVISPMLIDEDYYARVEGREIISNLAKAAGLATMVATIRPDIDHEEDIVRNTTARTLAVVASALGVPAVLPFLRAVCASKKSWLARHTGVRAVQQIAILLGSGVLPYVRDLVACVRLCLDDEVLKIQTITAHALASLAEACHPYGIESFDPVLRPLWAGVTMLRGPALAAFLKAIGFIIPLMDAKYAAYATREVMPTLQREFASPDDDMRRVVLKVLTQCSSTDGVTPEFLREHVLDPFFTNFWNRRLAIDRRSVEAVIEATVSLAAKIGCADIVIRVVNDLKDESEPYRRMVVKCIDQILSNHGADSIDTRLEERLVDGILYAFQEQGGEVGNTMTAAEAHEAKAVLDGFTTVMRALGTRAKPYMTQIAAIIKHRLNMSSVVARMQAADLCARVAPSMKLCGEETLLIHLGTVLYECMGEEYPDVLGSVLNGLSHVAASVGMARMEPSVGEILPRLTPILRNKSEKVQQHCIELVGRIADRGASFVAHAEWMRVCFQLIDLLRAPRKSIRRATVNTFGYIAKAIGPQDVLVTLLNNLRVVDRTSRVCSTVAMAIVAETCQPFTVLPALMSEYRVPEMNVQNGVLKALSFLFQYIGEVGGDYVLAITPLIEDALTDRDIIHRQTGCAIVKHMALGVRGMGRDEAFRHILNFVWPNIFESSPHVRTAVFEAVEAIRVNAGAAFVFQYILQGLFHPARFVREAYWQLYNNVYIYAQDELTPSWPRVPAATLEPNKPTSLPIFVDQEAKAKATEAGIDRAGELETSLDLEDRLWSSLYRRSYLDVIV
jgi:splicing factor 3B subunit 1